MRRIKFALRTFAVMLIFAAPLPAQSCGAGGAPVTARALAEQPEVSAALQVLDAWIAATVATREQPGVSIGIVYDQELIWSKGYGYADVQRKIPASPATAYRIASISKLFTSTAILQLRDAGRLQLDDPVAEYLPWFKIKNAHPDGPTITIRHLITHTSGLPREVPIPYWNEYNFPSRDEMIRLHNEQETIFAAETEWKYSNLALAIAGEIVAAVSGESYAEYVENQILKPLGMWATRAHPEPGMPGLAVGYGRRVPGAPRRIEEFVDLDGLAPAGNLASTVEDLARFVSLEIAAAGDQPSSSTQILKRSTLREMHRVQWLRPNWQSGQGLGFAIRRVGEQVRIGHGGSVPGHRTQIEIAPADKLAVIVLTNATDGEPMLYLDQAFKIVGPAIARATEQPRATREADPAWERYVGTYTWKNSDAQILVLTGELTMIVPEAENPWESRVALTPVGPHTFRMKGGGASGELLRFEVSSDGRVTRMTAGNFYRLRK